MVFDHFVFTAIAAITDTIRRYCRFLVHRNLFLNTHVILPPIAAAESFEIRLQIGIAAILSSKASVMSLLMVPYAISSQGTRQIQDAITNLLTWQWSPWGAGNWAYVQIRSADQGGRYSLLGSAPIRLVIPYEPKAILGWAPGLNRPSGKTL
ncbi:hypothetical protein F3Y22_tig00111566pilonHSYRG00108 [Hibiscus syriacus]|uniref:Uncharacterized protein n=1 Tax=Hibiscus syriacus TaxID=106335 RepID=A0A6A2Y142_HIBSY|nr:hypothetical protein F3Y22_tig00111566pilonHSYRG00108 [Hibiscus syriacus]